MLRPDPDTQKSYPAERCRIAGCPVALLAQGVVFPPPTKVPMGTFQEQQSEDLYVNMMPIRVSDNISDANDSLPLVCKQYLPLIEQCLRRHVKKDELAYLTIDERHVSCGESQRRGGVHVESPGVLPLNPHEYQANGKYIPGAEHFWGRGMMMRPESIEGGIFMASNVDESCAVWNATLCDPDGDVVGKLGDVRRLKGLLGPPAMILAAGDLVWMTDQIPHESLPLKRSSQRQYFRLVTGKVTAWFARHSTLNPNMSMAEMTNCMSRMGVNVIEGNKFEIYQGKECCKWRSSNVEGLDIALKKKALRTLLNSKGVGHLADTMCTHGICSIDDFIKYPKRMEPCITPRGSIYYESVRLSDMFDSLSQSKTDPK